MLCPSADIIISRKGDYVIPFKKIKLFCFTFLLLAIQLSFVQQAIAAENANYVANAANKANKTHASHEAIAIIKDAFTYHGPETELAAIINKVRQSEGMPLLRKDWEVARLARYKSEEMRAHRVFDHESVTYGNPAQLLDRFHIQYTHVGANIALGHTAPSDVVLAWLASPGHRASILDPQFSRLGVGLSIDADGTPYWTLLLVAD